MTDVARLPRAALRPARPLARRLMGSIVGVRTDNPDLGLTFDDGPDPQVTPGLLDTLERCRVRATFFVVGQAAAAAPALLRDVQAAGHEVALHGAVHRRLVGATRRDLVAVVRDGRTQLEQLLGQPVRFFRPPYGAQTMRCYAYARTQGLQVVMWSAQARDWERLARADMLRTGLDQLTPGGILLLHDSPAVPWLDRRQLLEDFLAAFRDRGWRPHPVGRLLATAPACRRVWFQ